MSTSPQIIYMRTPFKIRAWRDGKLCIETWGSHLPFGSTVALELIEVKPPFLECKLTPNPKRPKQWIWMLVEN